MDIKSSINKRINVTKKRVEILYLHCDWSAKNLVLTNEIIADSLQINPFLYFFVNLNIHKN